MNELTTARGDERPIDAVRGTSDWLPGEFARLDALQALLLDRFSKAGYEPMRTPVLEFTELHERKSGAGIVSKLFEVSGQGGVCLRPELTAGIVRAYADAAATPRLPWRVSHAGPVFRYETPRPGRSREFQQVGVERLGDAGPLADGEVVWLADWALAEAGVRSTTIRIGHVGLILEMLERSGLPAPLGSALVEMLSEAAADGDGVLALEKGLEQLAGWLRADDTPAVPREFDRGDAGGVDRLFRTLVPVVTGRRSGLEIVRRLRRKWDLGHGLLGALERVRRQVHDLADLKGKPPDVLARLGTEGESLAPSSVAALRDLLRALADFGIDLERVELDLGLGRGIGFYSRMIFEIIAESPDGPVEVGGGGRYDGLARVLGSPRDDRGVGFAIGLERLLLVLEAQGTKAGADRAHGVLVLPEHAGLVADACKIANTIRTAGARAVLETDRELGDAIRHGEDARFVGIILVDQDISEHNASCIFYDLASGATSRIDARDIDEQVPGRLL